jgi:hypothetical protein
MTALLVAFLAAHGLLHLAIWLPHPEPDPAKPPPFQPDHSAVLAAVHAPPSAVHVLSMGLAAAAAAAYLLAATAVVWGAGWAVPVTVAAALAGLMLKGLYFHPWLLVGIALDLLVLVLALTGQLGV